jgi:hypothetical protein
MKKCSNRVLLGAGLGLAMSWCTPGADAAVLVLDGVQHFTAPVSPATDLTGLGTVDWAYWAQTGNGLTPPVAPSNRKSGGSAVSSLTNVGGSTLRGTTQSATVGRYSFTDGTSPASATNVGLAGLVFNSDIGTNAAGKGLSFTVTGDPAAERGVVLFLGGFSATGNLTLTLNGATTIVDSSQVFPGTGPKELSAFTVRFQPDSAADVLTVQWTASDVVNATSGHVGIQAVAVAVPEPGAVGLGLVGAMAGLVRRRRR